MGKLICKDCLTEFSDRDIFDPHLEKERLKGGFIICKHCLSVFQVSFDFSLIKIESDDFRLLRLLNTDTWLQICEKVESINLNDK